MRAYEVGYALRRQGADIKKAASGAYMRAHRARTHACYEHVGVPHVHARESLLPRSNKTRAHTHSHLI